MIPQGGDPGKNSFHFSTSAGGLHSWASGPFLILEAHRPNLCFGCHTFSSVVKSPSTARLQRHVFAIGVDPDNPGQSPHLKICNAFTSAKSLLPNKVTFTASRIGTRVSLEAVNQPTAVILLSTTPRLWTGWIPFSLLLDICPLSACRAIPRPASYPSFVTILQCLFFL